MLGNHRLQRIRGRHQIVVGYLALFVALGGTAIAAKPLIDGADVQDESLTTADIRNESLTGDDILESSLGKVSSATTADSATTAGDAGTLDNKDSSDFLGANNKAADADRLDGKDSTDFLGATATAADSDKLDGKDSTQFLQSVQTVTGPEQATAAPGGSAASHAQCPSGTKLTGGGYFLVSGPPAQFHPHFNGPAPVAGTGQTWSVYAYNSAENFNMKFFAYARCAS